MRIIAKKTIVLFYETQASSKNSFEAFIADVKKVNWQKPGDVIERFPMADVITDKRFAFNIKGNAFRLVADIEFRLQLVYIVWLGTQAEYDKIDVKTIDYVKDN